MRHERLRGFVEVFCGYTYRATDPGLQIQGYRYMATDTGLQIQGYRYRATVRFRERSSITSLGFPLFLPPRM